MGGPPSGRSDVESRLIAVSPPICPRPALTLLWTLSYPARILRGNERELAVMGYEVCEVWLDASGIAATRAWSRGVVRGSHGAKHHRGRWKAVADNMRTDGQPAKWTRCGRHAADTRPGFRGS